MTATTFRMEFPATDGVIRRFVELFSSALTVVRKRQALRRIAGLDHHTLDDIGIGESTVDRSRALKLDALARQEQGAQLRRIAAHIPPTVYWR